MIFIVTALYAEAHAFIGRFQLKKDTSHTRFQVFKNSEAKICLIISGTGTVPAAVAVTEICMKYGAGQDDFLINAGACAGIRNKNIPETEDICQPGKVFLGSKIREAVTGRTFYPDILYRHGFREAQVVTGAGPYVKTERNKTPKEDFYLYDMEAAAVYQAGSYFLGPHQMSFLKVISDDGLPGSVVSGESITSGEIEYLIERNIDQMGEYILLLQEISCKEKQEDTFREETLQRKIERLGAAMHCSKTMEESLRQYIRYSILAHVDYASVIEEMYQEEKLPCKDKREGKQRFEELKERLL